MEMKEFIELYLNKPRCEKVVKFLETFKDFEYAVDEQSTEDKGIITIFVEVPTTDVTNVLRMEVTNYQNGWALKVKDNAHDIYERACSTTKIDKLIERLTEAFENDILICTNEEHTETDNIIISNLYQSIITDYFKMTNSFKHVCSDMNNMFSDTLKLFKDEVKKIELSEDNTILDLLKIFKYFDNRFQGYPFEKLVVLNTIASKILEYIGKVHSEETTSKDNVRITAESNPICYAHILPFYGGKCHRLHGHNGKLSITMLSTKDFTKKRPMIVSYGFLKGFLKYVDNLMDHTTLININKNVNLELIDGTDLEVQLVTKNLDLKMTEGYTLIPNVENIPETSNESTSEITLVNYIIPLFKVYLIDFICKEGVDNTDLTMFGLEEPIKFEFTWGETDSTYCTVAFSI